MLISGISVQEFTDAVDKAGALYGDNLRAEVGTQHSAERFNARVLPKQTGYQLGLPTDELAPGQKRSGNVLSGQRRVNAVCWHVYRDVLAVLFDAHPNVKISTALAKYYGRAKFYELYPETGNINVGSRMYPVSAHECCDCHY